MAQRQSKRGAQVWCAARSKPRPSSGSGTPQAPAPAPLAPRAPEPCVHLKIQPWVARLTGLQEEREVLASWMWCPPGMAKRPLPRERAERVGVAFEAHVHRTD